MAPENTSSANDLKNTVQALKDYLNLQKERGLYRVLLKEKMSETTLVKNLDDLRKTIGNCTLCRLSEERTNIVFGEGNSDARLMFIGEGPGQEEDRTGRPFVGKAGELLTRMIAAMGLEREDVYIANIVKCRPPKNRDPEQDEANTCISFLHEQIEIINPEVICCLGRIAAHNLLDTDIPISRLRGSFQSWNGIKVMPTFHPAYLLHNPGSKKVVWEDLQKIMKELKLT